jgi:hypothetical protein
MQSQDQRGSPVLLFVNTPSTAVANSRHEQKATNTMTSQTVNPDDQVVASFDHLANEQFATLIAQAQKTFDPSSQKRGVLRIGSGLSRRQAQGALPEMLKPLIKKG